jgi:hypothetical protein
VENRDGDSARGKSNWMVLDPLQFETVVKRLSSNDRLCVSKESQRKWLERVPDARRATLE